MNMNKQKQRIVSWYSCGAASAVATKLAIADAAEEGKKITIVNCEVKEEHPDNKRFLKECEEWFGQEIIILGNDKYKRSIDEVFWQRKYMAGLAGAPCTLLLKKDLRVEFERENDIQVMGYTSEEQNRVDRFRDNNNHVDLRVPLIDRGLMKNDCLAMIKNAGIELPAMYLLGYKNNNCRGCVKAQSIKYWAKIRKDFPKRFNVMAGMEMITGATICKHTVDGVADVRIKLVDIPVDTPKIDDLPDIQCGIFCAIAEQEYNN